MSELGRGSIPFVAIDAYARRFGINHTDDFDRFLDLIRVLDRTLLSWKPDA